MRNRLLGSSFRSGSSSTFDGAFGGGGGSVSSFTGGSSSAFSGFTGSVGGFTSSVGSTFGGSGGIVGNGFGGFFSSFLRGFRASRERKGANGGGSSENDLAHLMVILEQQVDQARQMPHRKPVAMTGSVASNSRLVAPMQALVA